VISGEKTHQTDLTLFPLCSSIQEYLSATNVLKPYIGKPSSSLKTYFLYYYSHYLSAEKQRAEKRAAPAGLAAWAAKDDYLLYIKAGIEALGTAADGFLLYLLGLVFTELKNESQARGALCQAVTKYPCNWSAWRALQAVCPDQASTASLHLPDHFASLFFSASLWLELQESHEALAVMENLSTDFKDSDVLLRSVALAYNNLQMYDEAQEMFEMLLKRDPHRIDGMDVYSNIIYVKEDYAGLAALARKCAETDPYRPETCCVIGNYYSLRGQHEKAIVYFRRALRLDPGYIPAWTLMGHEFVELKNPSAAIEAYQKAVGLRPNDYRAWYGLGQTYELVNMPSYALHYYDKAAQLRQNDSRMWNAMAHCYASPALDNIPAAIRCYERALENDKEGVAVQQLATLHKKRGDKKEAAKYYRMNLGRIDEEGLNGQDAVEALQYLAQYHKEEGELDIASTYFERLLDFQGAQEDAKSELRELQMEMTRAKENKAMGRSPGAMSTPGSDMGITPPPPR
jgi:anaphase-promoting complex subunit 8